MPAAEVYKGQELVYELRIGECMTRQLISISPSDSMRKVKSTLREKRISGMPVLEDGRLVGIVSIEDVIVAMERRELDDPVNAHMTYPVFTARADEPAVQALTAFAHTGVGRLPVLDRDGKLVGIITRADITRGVLKALQQAYQEEEIRRYRASHIFEDIASDKTSVILRYDVMADDFSKAGQASSRLKQTLLRLGLDPRVVRRVAIASYEAEMNIVIHSAKGGRLLAEVTPEWIALLAEDQGPGIQDVRQALTPGFSTAPDSVREMGFGAGMGLSNIESCADEMHLDSAPQKGTRLTAVIYLKQTDEDGSNETTPNRDSAIFDR
jgi:anti-sigma regulatory factor (Ser/Thr protein kinase)/predicted transcriptional regulator